MIGITCAGRSRRWSRQACCRDRPHLGKRRRRSRCAHNPRSPRTCAGAMKLRGRNSPVCNCRRRHGRPRQRPSRRLCRTSPAIPHLIPQLRNGWRPRPSRQLFRVQRRFRGTRPKRDEHRDFVGIPRGRAGPSRHLSGLLRSGCAANASWRVRIRTPDFSTTTFPACQPAAAPAKKTARQNSPSG